MRRRIFAPACRAVRGTRMIDFQPVWMYYFGEAVANLDTIQHPIHLPAIAGILHNARTNLDGFLAHHQITLFPETRDAVRNLVVWIDVMLPPDQPIANRVIADSEVMNLASAINGAIITFEAECGRVFIVGLEKQRALQPKTLIEEIEDAFSPDCWNRLSNVTKREIEESGKCLAFERYTAAGFHMLRALETEVRDYIHLLPASMPSNRNLGQYITTLKDNGAAPNLIAVLDNIRSLDRNPLIHPEHWLGKDEAIGIFNTAQTAIERIIADMEKRKLLPELRSNP